MENIFGNKKRNLIVIGNGMASHRFCKKIISKDVFNNFHVTVIGEEPRPAYNRVQLTNYYTGTSIEELTLGSRAWYKQNGIKLITGEMVSEINREEKFVVAKSGKKYEYDLIVLATGSYAFVPPIKGVDNKGVFVYRTIEDLEAIKAYVPKALKATVIGGGLLGLEAAKAILDDGLDTTIIEQESRIMSRQLDDIGSQFLRSQLEQLKLKVITGSLIKEIVGGRKVSGVLFNDNNIHPTDLIIVSAGIRPRDELARKSGIEVGPRGGIVVDDGMKTSDQNIYAIGECALVQGSIWGLVAPCYEMADIAALQIAGENILFAGGDMSTKLKLMGTDVASVGDAFGVTPGSKSIVFANKATGVYKRINISDDSKYLLGAILVGDASEYNKLLQVIKSKIKLPPNPEDIIVVNKDNKSGFAFNVFDLPDESTICSCENVSKGAICGAINKNNIENVLGIKMFTKAGTGCGGCTPMLDDLLTETLKAEGKIVKKILCEHFNRSRQELYDLIKIDNIQNFNDLIKNHGKGYGCEICKPAVASLLASIWNKPVPKHTVIQDTNDKYLANIQRGGTYSVVPRIPGGEITPEKLIAIGSVAKKYNLYTKITGGQRIDLFGARVDQLPFIWEELIDAGFESGHAYGKALRTIKSCVGSTWCRFGQQDSVSFAIEIEERYKGLRAPHKIKGGVSGCIRECAEARGKDFGIIATDKGWNLYVCGNGGANPQHAVLFAKDIDKKTCIKYIDRFLMFYIKTADPLTRTAKWLNSLEGGLDHLKDVVINDCLGMGDQFEKEMNALVDTYKCEWKVVVDDPELRKNFNHFVNAVEPDPSIKFVNMRGQKMPVEWPE
jgi:nitrite reductase (NADH) large subunit